MFSRSNENQVTQVQCPLGCKILYKDPACVSSAWPMEARLSQQSRFEALLECGAGPLQPAHDFPSR